jgi:hypothetical protein
MGIQKYSIHPITKQSTTVFLNQEGKWETFDKVIVENPIESSMGCSVLLFFILFIIFSL